MKINKLTLRNFSSFEGENVFDFSSSDDEKNIILIGGQNGAGKTSLFSAIKVALYGPLAFGYVGANAYYAQRVKEFINSKTFQLEYVEAGVVIEIAVKNEREYHNYELARKWYYPNQKFEEKYVVKKEGMVLEEQELTYFQNYLQSIIPPSLFDFFLFDGEEVGNIFATSSYNSYVKNALFTMCNMDVYEIIRKYTSHYISKMSNRGSETGEKEYYQIEKEVEELKEKVDLTESKIDVLKAKKEHIENQLQELEYTFKNAGGITAKEKEQLLKEYAEAEKEKHEMVLHIKAFVEGLMPFYIVKDFVGDISGQLEYEEKGEIFYYVKQKLKRDTINSVLKKYGISNEKIVDELKEKLENMFCPRGYSEDKGPIHDLSKEDIRRVNVVFAELEDFEPHDVLDMINKKQKASEKTAEINKILKSALSYEEEKSFAERENVLLKKNEQVANELFEIEKSLAEEKEKLVKLEQIKKQKYQKLVESVQDKHVYELSTGISNIMRSLLDKKTGIMKNQLEILIVENLHKLYRKDNLITHIEIEDNFQFDLYQNITYSEGDLFALIKNLGGGAVTKLVGKKGIEELFGSYNVNSMDELKNVLDLSDKSGMIHTYNRVELGRLSKGERQIFILSLYWAMIMISRQDIPFIIDTPYARIDANHRKEISKKFFPNISKQVIILSTDEEVNEEFYKILHPYIAKEYLLTNNEDENKTTIANKYFFEVK